MINSSLAMQTYSAEEAFVSQAFADALDIIMRVLTLGISKSCFASLNRGFTKIGPLFVMALRTL